METPRRTLLKAFTWQTIGLAVMTLIGFVATGSWSSGGAIAASTTAISTVSYIAHERIWARIQWGRRLQ